MSDEENKKEEGNNNENIAPEVIPEISSEEADVIEFEYNEDGEEDYKKTFKKLKTDLKQIKKEREEYLIGWQKERADFTNYKKDEDIRRSLLKENINLSILERFLSIIDSFNMAFSNREIWEKVDLNWRKGIEYIYAQFISIFEEYGVKEFGIEGEIFDPFLHESLEIIQTENRDLNHKIAKVIQKGYKMGERIIRPAKVNVFSVKE